MFFDGPKPLVALISYSSRRTLTVYASYGCGGKVSNGQITRTASKGVLKRGYRLLLTDAGAPTLADSSSLISAAQRLLLPGG